MEQGRAKWLTPFVPEGGACSRPCRTARLACAPCQTTPPLMNHHLASPQGYTIPLDKRLAADGRGLQQTVINDKFASLSESLFMAESKAREAIQMRSNIQKQLHEKEKVRGGGGGC